MGKNWKGGGRGGGRGGGGGGGDLASCRGYAAVIGTCDAAREKESNKELSNLLNQTIEQLYPPIQEKPQEDTQENSTKHESIEDMLRSEVLQVKQQKKSGQDVMSINIGIKGIVFAKINRRDVCPVKLVKSIMDRVKEEKVPCSRHLVKIIPLQLVYFAGETDLISTARLFVEGTFISTDDKTLPQLQLSKVQHKRKAPELSSTAEEQMDGEGEDIEVSEKTHEEGESVKKVCTETNEEEKKSLPESTLPVTSDSSVVDGVPASTTTDADVPTTPTTVDVPIPPPLYNGPEVRYFILFKARNHNTLNKTTVIQRMRESMPVNIRQDYMNGQNAVIVEALKNIAGISYFPDYYDYTDLNLRKHQALHCPQTSTGLLTQQKNDNIQSSSNNQEGEEEGKDVIVVEEKSEIVVESSMKEDEGNTVE